MPRSQKKEWILTYLFYIMTLSSFVMFEPSPYDLLIISFFILGGIFSIYAFQKNLILPILFLYLFLTANLLSSFFAKNELGSVSFMVITIYLVVTWTAFVGTSSRYKILFFKKVMNGYLIAACLAILVGVGAYFSLLPHSDYFLEFGRVKSFFKDPNVFGPFVIPAGMFALYKAETTSRFWRCFFFGVFLMIGVGVLLSFSRAAWGNFLLSIFLYFLFPGNIPFKKRMSLLLVSIFAGTLLLFFLANTPMIENLLKQRLSIQNYDSDRFGTQKAAFETGLTHLWGIGPGQIEENFQLSTHSLYARLFTENGILGFLAFIAFLLLSMLQAFKKSLWAEPSSRGLFVVVFSSLLGLVFNSFFIDTLHWRHFWLLLALAWCLDGGENLAIMNEPGTKFIKGGKPFENRATYYQNE